MAKKISKTSKRRLTLLVPLSLFMISFFIFTTIRYTFNIISLKNKEQELEEKLSNLEEEEENLSDEIVKLKDPEYIAKYAREKYYYTKDGEYVIKIEEKDKEEIIIQEENSYKKYILYGGILVLVIIFVFTYVPSFDISKTFFTFSTASCFISLDENTYAPIPITTPKSIIPNTINISLLFISIYSFIHFFSTKPPRTYYVCSR